MRQFFTFLLFFLNIGLLEAQVIRPFSAPDITSQTHTSRYVQDFETIRLDPSTAYAATKRIPRLGELTALHKSSATIELPLPDRTSEQFYIAEIITLSPESAHLYPEIKTYDVKSLNGMIYGRVTLSPLGINAMLVTPEGKVYIEPVLKDEQSTHVIYHERDYGVAELNVRCGVEDAAEQALKELKLKTTATLGDCQLRTYNFAVSATGEFTTLLGSQINAISSITATVANINLVFERDLGIHFNLVTNNSLVFANAATDPYPTVGFPTQALLDANTTLLNNSIGAAAYDLGMVFSNGWDGGLAYTPGVCNGSIKGGSASGVTNAPYGPVMENLVAHEIGHLFSAAHTMSSGTGVSCQDNLNLPTAYEIGGGSSIMAYAGAVCPGMGYQSFTDNYFHFNTVSAVRLYTQSLPSCGTAINTGNTAPVLTITSSSYTIPVSTAFELTATGTDNNNTNILTYTFEQYDAATAAMTSPPSAAAVSGPLFRSYPPSISGTRIFPALGTILSNVSDPWEVLPSVTRTMNFRVLVRDNNPGSGCVAQESITVNANSSAGPFIITSQNAPGSFTANGTNTMTINWNVANTAAAPVNATNVNIYFSTDNGLTFPYLLASNVTNSGTATVTVPNVNTTTGRIKVKAVNNIFFDINDAPITVTSPCTANGSSFSPDTNVSAQQGSPALNLNLSPDYGSVMTISGSLTTTDPASTLSVINQSGNSCISFSNQFIYNLFTFQVNISGTYTFTTAPATASGTVINLYEQSFNPSAPCTGFLSSNSNFDGIQVNIGNTVSATLNAGLTYVLAVGTFNNTLPLLPSSYAVNITPPSGGNIYSGTPDPGTSYYYRYVISDNNTGNIVAFTSAPDLSAYAAGNYTIYGLSLHINVTQTVLNNYAGNSLSSFQSALLNSTVCGNLSTNNVSVSITSPLQLRDIQLSAAASDENVQLLWNTDGEDAIQHYSVEKRTSENEFHIIGNIQGSGAGAYRFYDITPSPGMNYYRIRAHEKGDKHLYSNVAVVNFRKLHQGDIILNPNPSSGTTKIRFPESGKFQCALMDIKGQMVMQFAAYSQEFTLDISGLASGTYILRCTGTNRHFISRIVRE